MSSAAPMQHAQTESPKNNASQGVQLTVDNGSQSEGQLRNGLSDNRALAIAQRSLSDIANNSNHTKKLQAYQRMAQTSERTLQLDAMRTMMDAHVLRSNLSETDTAKGVAQTVSKTNNTGLSDSLKSGIENLSGLSMNHVKVHYNSSKPAQLNAHAYAQGSEIHVAPGQEQHLPHEAWHVVQQAQGRVKPTLQMKTGIYINDDSGLEAEAEQMGARSLQSGQVNSQAPSNTGNPGSSYINRIAIAQCVTSTETDYKKYSELIEMKAQEFDNYAKLQADWHASPFLNETQLDKLRKVLAFVREQDMLQTCGDIDVSDLNEASEEDLGYLRTLSGYMLTQLPISMGRPSYISRGVKRGIALPKLISEFGADALTKLAIGDFDRVARTYEKNKASWTDDLINYHQSAIQRPYFDSGADFTSYVEMREKCKENPLTYDSGSLKGNIRNYHRFQKKSLNLLQNNFNDTSKAKPVTLILHSSNDHNGAFHRSEGLHKVIADPLHHTLMVEGGESLNEYTDAVGKIATTYGIGNKLDQVLFSGHGGMRSVEMAGTANKKESIDLDNNQEQTDKLFAAVLGAIDPGYGIEHAPKNLQRRIVFDACLTNTNYIPATKITDSKNVEEINEMVRTYLKEHPTLKGYLDQLTNKKKLDVSTEGANAVTRASGLIDEKTGRLGLSSDDDTHLVADKLEYVAFGKEPIGVLRAAVECITWTDKSVVEACYRDMEHRVEGVHADWRSAFIAASFALVLKQERHNHAWLLSHLSSQSIGVEEQMRPGQFGQMSGMILLKEKVAPFFTLLKTSTVWGNGIFAVNILQAWALAVPDAGQVHSELLEKMADLDCDVLQKMISIPNLVKSNLLKTLLAAGNDNGRLKLALLGVLSDEIEANSKTYLLTLLGEDVVFKSELGIAEALNGISSPQIIQTRIGKPPPEEIVEQDEELANVTLAGDDKNRVKVHSITKQGLISKTPDAKVYKGPDGEAEVLGILNEHVQCHIFGETKFFYGIERKRSVQKSVTLYVFSSDLKSRGVGDTDVIEGNPEAYPSIKELDEIENAVVLDEDTDVTVVARDLGEDSDIIEILIDQTSNEFSSGFVLKTDITLL